MAELTKYVPTEKPTTVADRMDAAKEAIQTGMFDPVGMNYTDYEKRSPRGKVGAYSTMNTKAFGDSNE